MVLYESIQGNSAGGGVSENPQPQATNIIIASEPPFFCWLSELRRSICRKEWLGRCWRWSFWSELISISVAARFQRELSEDRACCPGSMFLHPQAMHHSACPRFDHRTSLAYDLHYYGIKSCRLRESNVLFSDCA